MVDKTANTPKDVGILRCEAEKKAIVEGLSAIVIFFDVQGRAVWANSATGRAFPGALGQTCKQIFCNKEKKYTEEKCDCAFDRSIASGSIESATLRASVEGAADEGVVYEMVASPVKDQNNKVSGTIVIVQNVTEKFDLEKQLRYTQKMEAIGTLAGGIAHDFNNVLTPIMGYSEIIRLKLRKNCYEDPAVFDHLLQIQKAGKRAKALVDQVRFFSQAMEQKPVLQHLQPIIREVMKLMDMTLPCRITMIEELDTNCGRVLIDPVQLHQILINLCTNASHAIAQEHGKITVRLAEAQPTGDGQRWLELSVADDGCGIKPELIERIFEPYFTTKEKTRGTGMGLAMVHGIVSSHGGTVEVESQPGEGSVFRLFFKEADESI